MTPMDAPSREAGSAEGQVARGPLEGGDALAGTCPPLVSESSEGKVLTALRRCMWPLPRLAPHDASTTGKSRGCQQRAARRRRLAQRVDASIESLNSLAGFTTPEAVSGSELDPVHQAIKRNSWESHAEADPHGEVLRPREAFLALRSTSKPASYAGLPTNLAGYQKDLVSMPQHKVEAASLPELLPEADREAIMNVEQSLFRPESEVMTMTEEPG